jgi:hypothetical protein
MKLILSRKGFDSAAGGVPSPILPDGRFFSLPIPHTTAPSAHATTYAQIDAHGRSAAEVLGDLEPSCEWSEVRAHLDPDLRKGALPRLRGWRPLFGQAGAAQQHRRGEGGGAGDLFLFFGWFRRTRWAGRRLEYVPGAPDIHVLFGWLEVGEVWAVGRCRLPGYAQRHPHAATPSGRPTPCTPRPSARPGARAPDSARASSSASSRGCS